jgi:antirestriction protein
MHERDQADNEHQDDQTTPEKERRERPRIYVASLSDYNEGRLYGKWIDADQEVDALRKSIDEMLAASPSPGAEEWAIHDYDGFGALRLDEYESLEIIAKIGAGIAQHGAAFAAWASHVGTESEELDHFEEAFMGEWESGKAWAEEMLDDLGLLEEIKRSLPAHLVPYVRFDYAGYFNDLVAGGDIVSVEKLDGGVYVFWNL